jgi:DNA damage-inducible protein 1
MENIQQNMEYAIENLPEAYARVIMLYVDLKINKVPVKAFVDSGAQSTIMSIDCAERCGITRFIDERYSGEAVGVGRAKIIGKVHAVEMQFGNKFLPISITILEKNDIDFLFGLDMLKSYQCSIDLKRNVLRMDVDSGVEEVAFLSENELHDGARGTRNVDLIADGNDEKVVEKDNNSSK